MLKRFKEFVLRRRGAYRILFLPNGVLSRASLIVLADLRKFCRADQSTIVVSPVTRQVDPLASAMAEGRREVWLRIMNYVHMDDADVMKLVDNPEDSSEY